MYAFETGLIMKDDELKFQVFERKILRKIYGPILNTESGMYERKKN